MDVRIRSIPYKLLLKGSTRLRPISMEIYDPSMDIILGCMIFEKLRGNYKQELIAKLYNLMKAKDCLYMVYKKIVYFLNHEINTASNISIVVTDDNNNDYEFIVSGKEYPIVKYNSFKELTEEVIKLIVVC